MAIRLDTFLCIYNPWSIINCILNAKDDPDTALKPYWVKNGSNTIFKDLFYKLDGYKRLSELLRTQKVHAEIKNEINLSMKKAKMSENTFLAILLQSGYLTETDQQNYYQIPNVEIKIDFYKAILPIWIDKKFGLNVKANKLLEHAIASLENAADYVFSLENYLLKTMLHDDKTESDFKLILGAPLIYALTINSDFVKHKVYTEMQTRYGKKIDTFFYLWRINQQLLLFMNIKK